MKLHPIIQRQTQVKCLQYINLKNVFVNISRVLFLLLCFFCLFLPNTSSATNPSVTINESVSIRISVSMSKVSGDNQQAQAGTTLSQALVVKVIYTNGTGVSGVPISFTISSSPQGAAGARLSSNQVTTDLNGYVQVTLTLGDKSGQYQVSASNPNISNSPVIFTATAIGGGSQGEYIKDENPDLGIFDDQTTISSLNIPDSIKISKVEVYVDITHTYIGDLIVTLISPSATHYVLHNRTGGSQDNIIRWYKDITYFLLEDAKGVWQLKVEDRVGGDQGSLNLWKIKILPSQGEEWKTYNYICESPHPYSNNYTNTWVIEHPGASKMRVHFEKYSIETDYYPYDKLYILDKNNNEICWYSGYDKTDIWTPVVSGDVVKIKLVTDYSVTAYGFKVDRYMAVGGNPPSVDTTPPAKITNLTPSDATINSIKLTWTAPGDDGNSGKASGYDIRYSTSPINESKWANATQIQNEPVPAIAGTTQNITISELQMDMLYYFGIKTYDESGNVSEISNIASLKTKEPDVIEVGGEASGSLSNRGHKWYRLYLAQKMQVWIKLTMDRTVDYDLRVHSGNAHSCGSYITGSWNGRGEPDICNISKSGYVWIKVYNYAGSGNYTLSVKEAFSPPQDWITTDYVIESPHNYPNNYDNTWTINQFTAGTISLHFSRLDTERGRDFVYIYDKNGNEIERYSGYFTDFWTPPIPGDMVKIRLKSSPFAPDWGFKVDKYAWTGRSDTIPPAQITNLQATNPQFGSITLTWTAPGDDGMVGTATQYDIRYSTNTVITEATWVNATQCQNEPIPAVAGTQQRFVVTGLQLYTQFYFAIKTRDEVNNWSAMSNVAVGTTSIQIEKVIITHTPFNPSASIPQTLTITTILKSRIANTGNPAQDFRYFTSGEAGTYTIWDGRTYYANNAGQTAHETSYWIEMLNSVEVKTHQWEPAWGNLTYNWTKLRGPNVNTNNWTWQNQRTFSNTGTYVFQVTVTHTSNGQTIQRISSHSGNIEKSRPSIIPPGDIENIQDAYMVHIKGTQTDAYAWAESFLTVPYKNTYPYPRDYHGIDCSGLIHASNWLAGRRYYSASANDYLTNNRYSSALGEINPSTDVGVRRNDWMGVDEKVNGRFDGTWNHIVLIKKYNNNGTPDRRDDEFEFIEATITGEPDEVKTGTHDTYNRLEWNLIFRRPR